MERQEAIDVLARSREGVVSVVTMQSVAPWHDAGQGEIDHIAATQCMGSASSIALGIALARPDRKVMVLDGDGSLLMQLGSLATIAGAAPENLYHFVFANGLHQSTGNQPLPAQGLLDWCGMATAAGYRKAVRIEQAEDLIEQLPGVWAERGPVLVELVIAREETEPRWAGVPMAGQVVALKASLAADR